MTLTLSDSAASLSLVGHFFVFCRIGAICFMILVLSEGAIPSQVKLLATILLTVCVHASLLFNGELDVSLSDFVLEVLFGLVIGGSLRVYLWCLQTAGTVAAQSTSLTQIMGNVGLEPMPAIGHLLFVSALCLLSLRDFFGLVLIFFVQTYDVFRPTEWFGLVSSISWVVEHFNAVFKSSFIIAAPFLAFSVLYNSTIGVINKAMPQLMVAFVGAPFVTFGSLFLLFLVASPMLLVWVSSLESFLTAGGASNE